MFELAQHVVRNPPLIPQAQGCLMFNVQEVT
jgi:hypothetical protein